MKAHIVVVDVGILEVDFLYQWAEITQCFNGVDALHPHVRNVKITGHYRPNLIVKLLEAGGCIQHIGDLHFEAQGYTMIGGNFALFLPVWDQTLIPLPLSRIKPEIQVGLLGLLGNPDRAGIALCPFWKARPQRHAFDADLLHKFARLPKLAFVFPCNLFIGHQRRAMTTERHYMEIVAGISVKPAVQFTLIRQQFVQVAVFFGGLPASGNLHAAQTETLREFQAALKVKLHNEMGIYAEIHNYLRYKLLDTDTLIGLKSGVLTLSTRQNKNALQADSRPGAIRRTKIATSSDNKVRVPNRN